MIFTFVFAPSSKPLVVVQSLSCVQLFVTPWTAACQPSLSIISWSLSYPRALSWWCCLTISSSATAFSLAFRLSQHQGLFHWVGSLHQVVKVLEFQSQHQSFHWIFGVDFLHDRLLWFPFSPRDFQESSSALPYSRTPYYPAISLLGIYPKKKEKKN